MSRYTYKCTECEETIVMHHSVNDKQHNCELCGAVDALSRIPTTINLYKALPVVQTKVGNIVKEHIEATRQEIENMKEKLKSDWVEDE